MNRGSWRNNNLSQLLMNGTLKMDTSWLYKENTEMNEAEYKRQIEDMRNVFGKDNRCVTELKLTLAILLESGKKYKEAEILRIELLEELKINSKEMRLGSCPRPSNPKSYWPHSRASPELPRPEIELPELKSELPALERIMALADDRIPETITSIQCLALNFTCQRRWEEAEWLWVQIRNKHERDLGGGSSGHSECYL
jgi:hypothetical protein